MTFATPSTPGTDFPITQHDCEFSGARRTTPQAQVTQGRLSHCTVQYVRDLAAADPDDACFFCAMGEVMRERLGRDA
jgi:hypothetical protein